ncbi:MAG: VTT domain-containing protein [Pseudoxanthomonas suwonensis]|nr:VTT domain-containing protein [Pseudoxanthomonas suwonensis]
MDMSWLDAITAWIGANPVAAGLVIFLIAFCDALVIVGIVVPALPLLFAVGTLIGLGHINGPYAVACAALGAFAGDASSYWLGHRWGPRMREQWPFRRYPQLLDRGEVLMRRHAPKAILSARYIGAVRPFVPAVAGMLRYPFRRYALVSALACVSWGALFLAPGWLFGASYDAVAAVADRLAIVLLALAAALALVWAIVLYSWRWCADHADALLARVLLWSQTHPHLGRYATALIDPTRPRSASLLLLLVCLFGLAWLWFWLLGTLLVRGEPLLLDVAVHDSMRALRNPLADRLMAALAAIGDLPVLGVATVVALAWLLWRRRWLSAGYWLATSALGAAMVALLGVMIDLPPPPGAPAGFGYPPMAITMATIVLGFFAVMIARELPGRRRVWPYLLGGTLVTLLGFGRLYLGAHWLSESVGGALLGIVWLLLAGIVYRSQVRRSFNMRPLSWAFYLAFAVAALWHAPRAAESVLARFQPVEQRQQLAMAHWWSRDWRMLPASRNERDPSRRWLLDVQYAGPLAPLQARMQASGWTPQPQADWVATLGLLDRSTAPHAQPVLPATLEAEAETLLLRRDLADGQRVQVLRLWRAPAVLDDGQPLWVGASQTLQWQQPLGLFGLWNPVEDHGQAQAAVRDALAGMQLREGDVFPAPQRSVLLIRPSPPAGPSPRR